MARFVSRKKPFGEKKKKSQLLKKSLSTINNRRNNNIPYKVESSHLVR